MMSNLNTMFHTLIIRHVLHVYRIAALRIQVPFMLYQRYQMICELCHIRYLIYKISVSESRFLIYIYTMIQMISSVF